MKESMCENCGKTLDLCVCSDITELATRLHVLILQHPQEPDKDLGSARLAHLCLPNSTLKVGLSWPNLKKALGRESSPTRWAVLYLGAGKKSADRPGPNKDSSALTLVNKQGVPLPNQKELLAELEGIVILDGTWSQAKTLWWRNAWLLKLRRAILTPQKPSLYRELRKEPRKECLSTIESIAQSLSALGEDEKIEKGLTEVFKKLLDKQRQRLSARRNSNRSSAQTSTKPD